MSAEIGVGSFLKVVQSNDLSYLGMVVMVTRVFPEPRKCTCGRPPHGGLWVTKIPPPIDAESWCVLCFAPFEGPEEEALGLNVKIKEDA